VLGKAMAAPAYAERLKGIDPADITDRAALARLPVLRKSDLPALHKASPPFGGFVTGHPGSFGRLFTSPGPIFEPEPILIGIDTADLGLIAFETPAREGMVVNEDLILEIVRPGIGDPVSDGDVGEIVVTSLDPDHPWIRLATGDLTAVLPGRSPCGRSNMRIKGWMGRADQTTKVKGMFVRPEQIAEIGQRHPELGRLRLLVMREGETDVMTLKAECASPSEPLRGEVASTLRAVTKLGGLVDLVPTGSLQNDGKVISDERG
jgi:phenylacetate-coenzyme A ligase PaaK-like adenylate-forming protein